MAQFSYYTPIPTVTPASGFNFADDGAALRAAMKGFGTDEQAIIDILTHRSNSQRQQISKWFTEEYGRNLIDDLKSELGGNFEDLIIALMYPPVEYLCKQLHKAMKGIGTEENTLIEILCTRTNKEIKEVVDTYERLYDLPLEEHLCSDTSGDFRNLLVLIITVSVVFKYGDEMIKLSVSVYDRPLAEHMCSETSGDFRRLLTLIVVGVRNDLNVDPGRAREEAEQLYAAGELKFGTDEEVFNRIMAHESFPHLKLVFEEYKNVSGRTIEQALEAELSGELLEAMLAIVECVQSPPAFFAKRLQKAMEGFGTDDNTLIRIIVSRSEVDLGNIKQEFERLYDKTLESAVKSETSGDYKRALVALIGGP